jgi:xanthine permease XanP
MFAALQHLLAIIVGIMTPPLIIANVLGFSPEMKGYLISMALFVSGIATFIQVKKIGPIGSGLLSIQGTSFAFLGAIISIGLSAKKSGATQEEILIMAISLGTGLGVVFVSQILSHFPDMIQKIFGSAITTGGLTAILLNIILPRGGVMEEQVKDSPDPASV